MRAEGGALQSIAMEVEDPVADKNVGDTVAEAANEIVVVAMTDVSVGASEALRVKMSLSRNMPLRGLAVSEMQDIAKKCSKWFPLASARDSLRKFKPQGCRDVATFAVTFHNFDSFLHVATAMKAVDMPTDAIVWPCICLEDEKGDGKTSTLEAKLQETAWSAVMERFGVAGERSASLPNERFPL
jgi:hypothetical protein